MKGMWIRFVLVAAALGAAAGCGGDETSTTGSGASGGGGSGGSGGAEGGGGSGGSATTSAETTTTTTTTTMPEPCEGVIADFTPEWKPSEGIHQGLCADAQQIAELFAACLEPTASVAACDAFRAIPENAVCSMCAISVPEDREYGPLTVYDMPVVIYENPGQCISEIEGDPSDASCGARVFFTIQCQVSACAKCEYGDDFGVLLKCLDAAKAGSCKAYADAEAECIADLQEQNVDIDVCLPPTSGGNAAFYQYLKDMTLFHCGP